MKEELQAVAYHEAGHVVVAELLQAGAVNFVSVRSHGGNSGGFTNFYQPQGYWVKKKYMEDRVMVALAGKASTEICFGETDVGTNDDLRKAFSIVERFVDHYCSTSFDRWVQQHQTSNDLLARQEMQMATEMERFYHMTKKLLIDNREFLDKVATALMNKDILTSVEIQAIKATCAQVA